MRAWIYDRSIVSLTSRWYAEVLGRVPRGAAMLDVGVGTAGALVSQAKLIAERDLHIHGVDIDPDYVKQAEKRIAKARLTSRVSVEHVPLNAHSGGPYDAIYFAASFMLFDDPIGALNDAVRLLKPDGRIFFTQTFHERKSPLMEKLKPMLVRVTSIDFGRVTYEEPFLATLADARLDVIEHEVIDKVGRTTHRLVVARPAVIS